MEAPFRRWQNFGNRRKYAGPGTIQWRQNDVAKFSIQASKNFSSFVQNLNDTKYRKTSTTPKIQHPFLPSSLRKAPHIFFQPLRDKQPQASDCTHNLEAMRSISMTTPSLSFLVKSQIIRQNNRYHVVVNELTFKKKIIWQKVLGIWVFIREQSPLAVRGKMRKISTKLCGASPVFIPEEHRCKEIRMLAEGLLFHFSSLFSVLCPKRVIRNEYLGFFFSIFFFVFAFRVLLGAIYFKKRNSHTFCTFIKYAYVVAMHKNFSVETDHG